MFEDKTFDNLMEQMLQQVGEEVDTRQGSIVYDALSPIAMELEQVYSDLGTVLEECFADTASYYYLIKRCAERGILVKEGKSAVLKVEVTPIDVEVPPGTQVNIGELNYTVTENLGSGLYSMTCEEAGTAGNNTTDDVVLLDDVEGLETIKVNSVLTPGTDDESEAELRERYFGSFSEIAFGGNTGDYKEKADSFEHVGGCKVLPIWNGAGTVKLIIVGADYSAASAEVVSEVQNAFDPDGDGKGVGIAPIGHIVTVASADTVNVDIACTLTFKGGYVWDDIKDTFAEQVADYLLELRKGWEDTDNVVVRVGEIESILLGITGVDNVSTISINSGSGNLIVDSYKLPIGGEYSGTTSD